MKKIFTILFLIMAIGYSTDAFALDRSGECVRDGKAFSTRVATCTRAIIMQVVDNANDVFIVHAQRITSLVVLLAVILFGVKVASGAINMHQVMPHLVLMILKIGLVTYILTNYAQLAELPMNLLDEIIRISTNWIDSTDFFSQQTISRCENLIGTSPQNLTGNPPSGQDPFMLQTWWNFDCMALMTLGAVGSSAGVIAILGIFVAVLSMPGLGLLLLVFAIALLWVIFGTIFKGLFVYVRAVLVLGVLIIMTPFFLPFVFFSHTKGYVDELFETYLETIFQPAIFFAIISMFVMFLVADGGPLERLTTSLADLSLEKCTVSEDVTTYCIDEVDTGLQKVYNFLAILVALITPLILGTAMIGFANHAERVAGLFSRTPADAIGASFSAVAPMWAQERVAYAANRFENWKKEAVGGGRGHHSHREFKSKELERDQMLASIESSGLSEYEKGVQKRVVKDQYKETVARMQRANKGKMDISGGTSALLYENTLGLLLGTTKTQDRMGGVKKGTFAGGLAAKYRREIIEKRLKTKDVIDNFKTKRDAINANNALNKKQKRLAIEAERRKAEVLIDKRKKRYEQGRKNVIANGWGKAIFKKHWYGNTDKDV